MGGAPDLRPCLPQLLHVLPASAWTPPGLTPWWGPPTPETPHQGVLRDAAVCAELTVNETFDFAARCMGSGTKKGAGRGLPLCTGAVVARPHSLRLPVRAATWCPPEPSILPRT